MTKLMGAQRPKPIKTYEVHVDGYGEVLFSSRTPAKARWQAYQAFGVCSTCTFSEFLARSSIRLVANPPGIGDRIYVCGKPATRVIGRSPGGNYYIYDDSDFIYTCHDSEITRHAGHAALKEEER